MGSYNRLLRQSVRLVKDVKGVSDTPDTTSFPLISTVPDVVPKGYDGEVTIIFNPNEGNKGMQLATACYAHTGLITSASSSDLDWKNVVEGWRVNTSKTEMTRDGDNWKLVIPNIYEFYGCSADTEIKKLAFVFHDGPNGNREGKTAEGTDIFVVLEEVEEPESPSEPASGVFSVSADKQVTFSPGNLQYTQSTNTWSFASAQWEVLGFDNVTGGSVASDPTYGYIKYGDAMADKVDLFGWSTSATNFGVSTSKSNSDYSGSFVDWGTNKIGNDAPNTWRTLTYDEWCYLLKGRPNASSLRGVAQVNGVNGLIFLPDNWTCPAGITFKSGFHIDYGIEYYSAYQSFTADQWSKLEATGAIFLPAAGCRNGASVRGVQDAGFYWSATECLSDYAYILLFSSVEASVDSSYRRSGLSVRLVKDVEGETTDPEQPGEGGEEPETPTNIENGHEYVDLGLPSGLKWATCNVGATKPEEYGDYFAWGETEPKDYYDWSTYKWCNGIEETLTKYNNSSSYGSVDNKTVLETTDDAATVNWGGSWRIPTKEELDELRNNCTWTWTKINDVNGYKVTSNKNGNSIFLPMAGYRSESWLILETGEGQYWLNSLYIDGGLNYPDHGLTLRFYSGFVDEDASLRFYGQSVRPVCQ